MTTPVSPLLGVDFTATPTTADFPVGTKVTGSDGTEWVYVQANGAITQYHAVGIDENYQAASITKAMADDGWQVGFAQVAFADNDYGWVAVRGSNISTLLHASCAADSKLYTSSVAGQLDDSATSQTAVLGVVGVSSVSSVASAVEVIATLPRSGGF